MTTFVNLTPHAINLNDGTVFPASGTVARVGSSFVADEPVGGVSVFRMAYGEIVGLPEPTEGTVFIVSALVLAAVTGRTDVVAPSTGHPSTVRNEAGHIVSVAGFVR